MEVESFIESFKAKNAFSHDEILALRTDRALRVDLINYFRDRHNRQFALALLDN